MPNERQSSYCGQVTAQFPFLFSIVVTGPTFTKLLHDVEALVALLTHAYRCDIAFRFGTPEQIVKAVNFDVWKTLKINWLRQQCPLGYCKTYANLIIIHMSTNAKKLVKIGLILDGIFCGICRFWPSRPKDAGVALAISGVTGPILTKLAHDVATILLLNIFESELPYSYPFRNASLPNEGHFANFAQNWLHGNVP